MRRSRVRVAVLDYGVGNMHSLAKALEAAGGSVDIDGDVERALDADLIVLPGVGAFTAAAERLAPHRDATRSALMSDKAALGICLGMQLLFERSEEGPGSGLGVLRGSVTRLRASRVPHMGWNDVSDTPRGSAAIGDAAATRAGLTQAYYAHGYVCRPADPLVVTSRLSVDRDVVPTIVRWRRVIGVQFHPEKSGDAGGAFLREVIEQVARDRARPRKKAVPEARPS